MNKESLIGELKKKSRKQYMREYMRKYREAESETDSDNRREQCKIYQRRRRENMSDSEKNTEREKQKVKEREKRYSLSDEQYLKKLKENRFKYGLRITDMDAESLQRKRETDAQWSRTYKRVLDPEFRGGHFNINSRYRKPIVYDKHREEFERRIDYSTKSRLSRIESIKMGYFPLGLNGDRAFEPFLSYLAMNNFFKNDAILNNEE